MQSAYILHSRPFQETSLILELFTRNNGRLSVLARGAKRSKKQTGLFQLFLNLDIAFVGKTELPTLTTIEFSQAPIMLNGKSLVCGFYLNELLMRVLHKHDPHPEIFDLYNRTISALSNANDDQTHIEIALRKFEKQLLTELGYGVNFQTEAETHETIQENKDYQLTPNKGFIFTPANNSDKICGAHIIAIVNDNFFSPEILKTAKKIMRAALQPLVGDKPLKSREIL
jgi:DNA repair protein RecO (recombination protein O)